MDKNKIIDIVEMIGLGCAFVTCINALGEPKRMKKAELIGKLKGIAITHLDGFTNEDEKVDYMVTMVDYYKKIVDEELKLEHKTLRARRVAKVAKKLDEGLALMSLRLTCTQALWILVNNKASDETEEHFIEWKNEKMVEVMKRVDSNIDDYLEFIIPLYAEYLSLIK